MTSILQNASFCVTLYRFGTTWQQINDKNISFWVSLRSEKSELMGVQLEPVSQCRLTSSHPSGIGVSFSTRCDTVWLKQSLSFYHSLSFSPHLFSPVSQECVFQLTWSWIVRALAYLHSPQSSLRSGTASTDTLVLKLGSHWVTLIGLARWRDLKPNHKHITLDFTSRRQCRAWRSTKTTHLTDQQHAPSKALRVPL